MFHPNVEPDGKICVDFLQDEWKPSYTIGYREWIYIIQVKSIVSSHSPESLYIASLLYFAQSWVTCIFLFELKLQVQYCIQIWFVVGKVLVIIVMKSSKMFFFPTYIISALL